RRPHAASRRRRSRWRQPTRDSRASLTQSCTYQTVLNRSLKIPNLVTSSSLPTVPSPSLPYPSFPTL
ncbi:hypothetical protein PMAYCL1PPCAC_00066, partial [Pristionchus mayeri]